MAEKRFQLKDAELFMEVQKLMDGNYDSYQNVYELSKKYIYKIINDIVMNHHTTEDLMQETYLQIYRKIDTLMEAKAFYVWAGRIATNLTLRHIRKNKKEELFAPVLDDEEDTATIFDRVENDTEAFIPETVLENAEQQRIIANILEGLSAEQKICVQYYYFEELSVNDIANIMQCSTGTVKSRLNYARKALKEAIKDFEVKNDVTLYSLAGLPIFFIVFKEVADSVVFSVTAVGTGSALASGVTAKETIIGNGATIATGSAGVSTGASAGGSVVAGILGKVAIVVTAVVVSIGSVSAFAKTAIENAIGKDWYQIFSQERTEEDFISEIDSEDVQSDAMKNIKEFMGESEVSDYQSSYINEDYLKAIDNLAAAMVEYQKALQYSMTEEEYMYIDEIMSAYYSEMENYLNQGVQFGMVEQEDYTETFALEYMPRLTELMNEEAILLYSLAEFYSTEEVKTALHKHTADELKDVLEMGGGAGDLIVYDISEESANHLYQISEQFIVWMNDLVTWSENVMSDPNLVQYFN